ncbi:BspA family leucine-rich repeat surface protein [Vibrio vulnificus]|uniref:BspA family leucine-rich repeat surface protein n=1 Tax=Vibrio vulnificus TaxID=672 RepID=UPI000CD10A75|nr:BspA family leucine-rich repeat surface protein [Vibrio vulnificus]POB79580.1 hypothetical protein CRN30_15325 [Vibrio vulnificus]
MKKTIITLALLTTFASNAAFVSFVGTGKFNIASDDPAAETGQIIGGGEYVSNKPSNGGVSEPVVVACEGPELTRNELINLIDSGNDYSKACVGTITDFSELFRNRSVDYDITNWDVSSGQNFATMFSNAQNFNQDLSSWNVSNGIIFDRMFEFTQKFNQDISNWNVSKGIVFDKMFFDSKFNQDISSWNVLSASRWHDFNDRGSLESENIPAKFR